MLSRFAIGLAILLDQQALWSIEVPWYFHKLDRQECYDYEHYHLTAPIIGRRLKALYPSHIKREQCLFMNTNAKIVDIALK